MGKQKERSMINRKENIAIHNVINAFEKMDMGLFEYIAEDVDLAIDHYKDDADTKWQQCQSKQEMAGLLGRLAQDVFPKGTHVLALSSQALGDGWYITTFSQQFWYGILSKEVIGKSLIVSHELDGQVDYFRETVQAVEILEPA